MKNILNRGLSFAVAASVLSFGLMVADNASAQSKWPEKTVRMIVPAPPGSAPDGQIRLLSQKLSELWGQPVVVENIVGAGGLIGADRVAKAAPDGYTFLYNTIGPIAVAPSLMPTKMTFSPEKDLTPVSLATKTPNWITVLPTYPAKNIQELIALAKKNPGKITYGTSGPGTTQHLTGELLNLIAGIQLNGIPYKSSAQMTTDGLGGQIDILIHNTPVLLPHLKAGKLKALAITSDVRSPSMPNVPTMIESGVKNFEITAWFGFMAPAGTPKAIVDQVSRDVAKVLAMPDVNKRIVDDAAIVVGSTPEEYAAFIKAETAKWKDVIIRTKMTAD
ncbi:MAG: Bug family tripartite tricarboxylate transporter substrate binding protein [Betaproteobacteria bacterium]